MTTVGCVDGLITIPTPDGPELTACRGRCCTRPGPAYNTERLPNMSAPLPPGTRLAIPPMHPDIPHAIRVQVYELVMRRCFGEAYDLAQDAEDARRHRSATAASLHSLMRETPHKNARGYSVAA